MIKQRVLRGVGDATKHPPPSAWVLSGRILTAQILTEQWTIQIDLYALEFIPSYPY